MKPRDICPDCETVLDEDGHCPNCDYPEPDTRTWAEGYADEHEEGWRAP